MINRRHVIAKIFSSVSVIALSGIYFRKASSSHELLYRDLLAQRPVDTADLFATGQAMMTPAKAPAGLEAFLRDELPRQLPNANGKLVELGVHLGPGEWRELCGRENYRGVDLVGISEMIGLLREDVRNFPDLDLPDHALLVWNGIGTWKSSPRSRKAALEWACRNLQPGGIYIDADAHSIPTDLDYSMFELILKRPGFTIFKKT